jgi:hypothetical protein
MASLYTQIGASSALGLKPDLGYNMSLGIMRDDWI